jgi:hypothetical protein
MNPTAAETLTRLDEIGEKIEAENAAKKPQPRSRGNGDGRRLDVERYLRDFGRKVVKVRPNGTGTLYCLEHCVFDENHTSNEAAIGQTADGKLTSQCYHDSCKGKTWHEARKIISGDVSLEPWLVGGNGRNVQSVNNATRPMSEEEAEREAIRTEGAGPQHHSDDEKHKRPWELPGWQSIYKPKGVFPFTPFIDAISAAKPVAHLIEGILYEDGLDISFGETGTLKSFDKDEQMMCVVTGKDYHGHKVKQGAALLIPGEGAGGVMKRIKAWAEANGVALNEDLPFFISNQPAELLNEKNVQAIREEIDFIEETTGIRVRMIVVDTTNTNIGAGDDGNPKDMTTVMYYLRKHLGGRSYSLISHVGLADQDRPRGFSGQRQNADTMHQYVRISPPDQNDPIIVRVTNKKMKDGSKGNVYILESRIVPVEVDGVTDTTLVLDMPAEREEAAQFTQGLTTDQGTGGRGTELQTRLFAVIKRLCNMKNATRVKGALDDPSTRVGVSIKELAEEIKRSEPDILVDKKGDFRMDNLKRTLRGKKMSTSISYDREEGYIFLNYNGDIHVLGDY